MRVVAIALAPLSLAACVAVPEPYGALPAPSGTTVGLGQGVRVGDLVVTPIMIVEDSRCPINARCVWAGRLIVQTRFEGKTGAGAWRDSANIQLGETYGTHGKLIALTSGEPGRQAESETPAAAYRFTYDARPNIGADPGSLSD